MPVLNLPTDYQRSNIQSFEGDSINFELNEELTSKLKHIAEETGSTMYMVLLSACNVLLSKYSGQEDIVIGSPIAGRPHADSNMLPIRNYPESSRTFKEFLAEVKISLLQALENQAYQFEELIDKLGITRDLSRNPLFDVMFTMQSIEELKFKPYEINNNIAKFDMTIKAIELDKTIEINLNYCTKLFSKQTIENMSKHLTNILDCVANNINLKLSEIEMLTEEEKHLLLVEFNNTKVEYPKDITIYQLFEEQAEKTPNNVAVVYKKDMLTYKELNEKANIIARLLRSKGIKQNDIVGIMIEGSTEMLVGILGILKAGAAYLPIDPKYPTDRIDYMIKDSKTEILLTDFQPTDMIAESTKLVLLKDEELYKGDNSNLAIENSSKDIAYVIYTSGSTGKPKGVMIEHSSLINLCKWHIDYYKVTEKDNSTKYAGFGFDASVWEIFPYIITGAAIHIIDEEIKLDIEKLNEYYNENNITISFLPTQICEQFMKQENKSLRYLLAGGDKLRYFEGKNYKVVNNYEPTENTVVTTSFLVDKEYDNIPIGKPIANTQIYITNKENKLQPIGIPGELCIAGESLARGYLNNEELTAVKFTENPFEKGQRLYKTGDLARWLPDGNIEFLGRIDNQVKVRGYRIELGEIETRILSYEGIKEVIVIARQEEGGNNYLCAYISGIMEFAISELREYLAKELPEYMVPAYIMQLDKLPLTANGKIDRKALPEPDGSITTGVEYAAPTNEIEEKLVSIWSEVLGIEKIGINDNFFELGGHSLKAINIITKLHKELNISVPIKQIFETPTIRGLASYAKNTQESIYSRIEAIEDKAYYELSSAQKRMYAINQLEKDSINYNIPWVMRIEGELDKAKLNEAFIKLIERHEALRTSFEIINGEPVQIVHKHTSFEIEYTEITKENSEEIETGFAKVFDLSKAPLFRATLAKINDKEHILLMDMHHIISDGVSMGIFTQEIAELYEGKELAELRIQYKDFAVWQNELFKSEEIKKQGEYWLEAFKGEIPVLNLSTDYQRPSTQSFEGDSIKFEINEELTSKLKQVAKETGSTMYMVLLSACNVLLSKYSGQEDIIIGSPAAGRPHADLQNIMGMFVNTLAMRNYPESNKTYKEFLAEVKVNSLQAFEMQDYQFEELVDKLNIRRDISRNPLFDIMFTLQNMDAGELQIEGLVIKSYEADNKSAIFDMTIIATELAKTIEIKLNYCTKLFYKQTIENMSKHLENILNSIVDNINSRLSDIEMLSEDEQHKLLVEFNNTKAEYAKDIIIQQLFEEQAERTPDKTAVVYMKDMLTYKELNEKANIIARVLRNKGIKQNEIVGIMIEGGTEMLVGILGILKAGAAYLPIDPKYPTDRIEYMIEDSKTKILLTDFQPKDIIGENTEVILLNNEKLYKGENTNLDIINTPKDIAYIIYTSGSTGKPKGVMIEHSSLVNMCKWNIDYYKVTKEDNITKYAGFGFDASVWEIFPCIITGAAMHIIDEEIKLDLEKLNEYYNNNSITISFLPTQIAEQFMKLDNHSLRYLQAAGDKLRYFINKNYDIVNNYGPTENTVVTTSFIVDKEYENIPIGKPIANTQIYILSKENKLQAVGIPGELCIAGESLARGYLNREELTAEKFIENPLVKGQRLYKTGDLARWLPDGNIEFLGRIDNQVKVRGYRIELGEIEGQLLSHSNITEAVVIDREDIQNNKYLCGYIVSNKEEIVSDLREYLSKVLPEYMIPSYIVQLDKLPLTANGKVDRKALPKPEVSIETGVEYAAPSNTIEEKLTGIWSEVLGVERIGINDNFFALGGHSLKAINITAKIHKELNVLVPIKEMFETPTIKGLADYVKNTQQSVYSNIEAIEEKEYYELSSAQKRMYAVNQLEKDSINYNIPWVMRIEGELDKAKLNEAFNKLIERHEALRTSFEVINGEPVQIVHRKTSFEIEYTEITEENNEEIEAGFAKAFDLSKAPLLRATLAKINDKEHMVMVDMHHIISDAVSMGIITKEIAELYEGKELAELRIQYKDFAAWQNELFKSEEIKKQGEYWLKAFEGEIPVINLPTNYQRPSIQSFEGDSIKFEINEELTSKLRQIAKETGSTMYMVLLSACNVLLSKYAGQEDIVIGSPAAGRPHADLQNIMGMFVNTLAMRNYPESNKTFKEFLTEVKARALQAYENQDYQFEELIDKLTIKRDVSRNPLFDVMFSMENVDIGELRIAELKANIHEIDIKIAKFDITIAAIESSKTIGLSINYCTKLFNKQTIETMSKHLTNILNSIASNINLRLSELEMLSEEEKYKVLYEFNNTKADYPSDKTLHQLFEQQVEENSDNIALIYGEESKTYKELDISSNQLARTLREKGVKPNSIVGIMVERSFEMIVGIMGILKAGGAYLPIDPEYPEDRISFILKDSKAELLLTQSKYISKVEFDGEILDLEDEQSYINDGAKLINVNSSKDIAYVIYTSGSTGTPKGVMIEHESVVNTLTDMERNYPLTKDDVYLLKTSYTFDVSVTEIFGWFIGKGKLAILKPGDEKDVSEILNAIEKHKVTHINFVPSMLNILLEGLDARNLNKIGSLKYVFAAGEALIKETVNRFYKLIKTASLENIYGPTETTIYVTRYSLKNFDNDIKNIPIGKPLSNIRAYIVDKDRKLQPVGIHGELCFAGVGLGRGYLNRPELTAEKFVENPFVPGERMYKTGDLARWMPDGNIEFLGRIDHQVKIRGFRIELGEIESQLLKYEGINEVIVVAKEDKNRNNYLCGYICGEREYSISELREHLAKELPEYMIPSYIIQLEKLPLTANGKVDRKSLPEPDGSITTGVEYVAPSNEIEEKLVSIWQEVLEIERVGINDNFFELGGHSLKAINISAKIQKELNVLVPLKEMFGTPTIKGLANYVKNTQQSVYNRIEAIEEKEYYEVSSAQKRMYVINQLEEDSINYNIPWIMRIEGELDKTKLNEAFNKLIERHEAFRTSFEVINGEPVQIVHRKTSFEIEYIEITEEKKGEIETEFIKAFDLSKAPLFRVTLAKINDKEHILMMDIHHIISDGVSMGIVAKEITKLYEGKELAELRIQYKDFAVWHNELFKSEEIKKQGEYWLKAFEGEIPVLNLPTDFQRPRIQSFEGDSIKFEISEELTSKLKQIEKKTGSTMHMVLLSACNILLSKYSGQEDIIIGSPAVGRSHADLQNIIGIFINTLAMRNYPAANKTFEEFLSEVKANSLLAFESQDYQFEELIDKLNITRDLSRNPLFDVMFSTQNMDIREPQIEGLKFETYDTESNVSKFDLTLTAIEAGNSVVCDLRYCTKLFKKSTIERMVSHFINLIKEIADNPQLSISEINMLSEEEKHELLHEYNGKKAYYQKDKTIHELFEEQAYNTPDKIAVVFEDSKLTYKELNEKSNQLARLLRDKGAKSGTTVGIMVEQSLEMIISIIAVLKAGAAYLPIDTEQLGKRTNEILEDSDTKILLVKGVVNEQIAFKGEVINVDDSKNYENNTLNLSKTSTPDSNAYLIYTSGSTGKPKGVFVRNYNLANYIEWFSKEASLRDNDKAMLMSSYAFDLGYTSIYSSLLNGCELHIVKKDLYTNSNKALKYIKENEITYIKLTPSLFNILVNDTDFSTGETCEKLRLVVLGGEKINTADVETYHKNYPNNAVMNHYGPTEATIGSVYKLIDFKEFDNFKVCPVIGKPITNTNAYVMDKNMKLQPIGIYGELCLSGEGIAGGYFKRPDLTEEKFIQSPFEEGEKIYKTGDLVRRLEDGSIELAGRIDHQVKIRGFRIELGEIESQLLKYEEISEVIVIAKEDNSGSKYLCAYICGEREYSVGELREHLAKELPEYMIPTYFIQLDKLPLTANGKVDRKALPEPDGNITTGTEYVAPSNETEEKLAAIWQEVLGLERIGINDNFFELGGHSLKAINIVAKIHKELNVSVPLREMFKTPTIKGLANYVGGTKQSIYSLIEPAEEKEYYELSSAQKRIYALQQFEENNTSYNMPMVMTLEGELDRAKLEETFNKLIQRHESLRTSFELADGEPVQVVHKEVSFKIGYTEADQERARKIVASFVKAFDLSKAPLLRVGLTKISDKEHILMVDMNHIISDGISRGILTKEITELYDGKELPKLRIQYKDFAVWQNKMFKSGEIKKQGEYWLKAFEGEVPVLSLPTDYQRPSIQSFEGDNINLEISEKLSRKLSEIAKETGSTMYMVLLSACNILLSKYSGQEDIIIGSPAAGRPHADIQNIMGMFVNTLAMRNYPESNKTFREFLTEVKTNSLQAFENQDYQFEELVDNLSITRDLSRNPIFDVMFSMQNMNIDEMTIEGLKFKLYEVNSDISKFDITITAIEQNNVIEIELNYCTKLFNKQTIENMSRHLINILNSIAINTNQRLSEIKMLSEEEKHQLLVDFNNTKTNYPREKTIQQLYEEQADKTPDNIAVVFNEKQLTYRELNKKANTIARILKSKGIKEDEAVAILADKSIEMIIGVLAILKAGGAYLPIDVDYPKDRIEYILSDSASSILLTQANIANTLNFDGHIIILDNQEIYNTLAIEDNDNLEIINKPNNLAYIMYTSGSTGRPKGVMVEHKNVVRLVKNTNYISFNKEDRILQTGALVFDASTLEIWGALLNGLPLYLFDKSVILDANKLTEAIEENNITIMWLTVALFNQLIQEKEDIFKGLRYLLVGGDVLSPKHINAVKEKNPSLIVINGYGPTENTTFSTCFKIEKKYTSNIPIGSPISNSTAYIVDKNNNIQPIGVAGELWVGGDGVARGYLNNPELTAEKFIENLYVQGERIYKTGDLARWLSDGTIDFIGRIDQQVKIRGFRIELGEIENELLKHSKIRETIVIAKEDDSKNKYICAYIAGEAELSSKELREHLTKELPEYMIPTYFIQLDKLPLTANGKIDRKALPEPAGNIVTGTEYVAPSNEIEEKLASIWSEVIGVEIIGINDNFFELGGHSLKAINIIAKIHKELSVSVPLKEMFETPTIKGLAQYVKNTKQSVYSKIERIEEKEHYELSSVQKRMYAINQIEEDSVNYNMPWMMRIEGEPDKAKLNEAFNKLIDRHEALRTSFEIINGEPVQIVHRKTSFEMGYIETNQKDKGQVEVEFIKAFDLSKAPLFRVTLAKINDKEYILMMDIHHIISDGISLGILTKEFMEIYDGKELVELRIQYKDFAAWQNKLFKSEEIRKQGEYWQKAFEGEVPVLNLPTDYQRPSIQSFEGDSIIFEISEELTDKLRQVTKETGSTMYMVLLSACNILLSKYSGQEDIIIGSPSVGRSHADLQNIMGMFVNTLVMRNYPKSKKTFKEFLREVKVNSLQAFENQDYQFEELIDKLNIKRDVSRNPLFDVMFSLENIGIEGLKIEGLEVNTYEIDAEIAKFDITIAAKESSKAILISLNYCTKLFNKQTIEAMSKHLINILDSLANNINQRLSEVEILSDEEKHQLLVEYNNTKAEYPKDKTIQQLFEQQAAKTPDNIAVVYKNESITYRELNEKSNQLARMLREKGIEPNTIVGIMVERSVEMIVGIMGILKAGAAYLPIDSEYPEDRIRYILSDSGTRLLLQKGRVNNYNIEAIALDEDFTNYSTENLKVISDYSNLAYIIYTSGSTGKPKGTMIKQRGLVNYITWANKVYVKNESLDFPLYSSFSFDLTVTSIFTPLISGNKIVIYKYQEDEPIIRQIFKENKVGIVKLTPAHLSMIKDMDNSQSSIKRLIVGGEDLKTELAKEVYESFNKNVEIYNEYGPTETVVGCMLYRYDYYMDKNISVSIGKPADNVQIYILDKVKQVLPIGIVGEIYIGGDGVSKGYINRAELTSERFIANPFVPGEQMYRTGDLARWLPDGNIEFLGRIDNQVKIRGYRIELGEVEARLLSYEGIEEAIVIAGDDKDGSSYLCAYISGTREFTISELRTYLNEELPEYMIPSYFIQLDKLPLTANGKVDKKALPEPDGSISTGAEYVAPESETEEKLASIWSEVLGVERIGINDNFFELGGHSLKAINIIAKIHKELSASVPLKEMFETPTIKGLAQYVKNTKQSVYSKIEPIEEKAYYELSSVQKRMYAINQLEEDSVNYNMPWMMRIEGEPDKAKLNEAFNKLIERHETLRTSFEVVDGEPVQIVHKEVNFEIEYTEITKKENGEIDADFVKAFDLSKAPLFKVTLAKINDLEYLLMIDMHHIISDGLSMSVFTKEFIEIYNGKELTELKIQYKDFAAWQNKLLKSEEIKKQEQYWLKAFEGEVPVLNLSTDYQRPSIQSFEGDSIYFEISEELTDKLKQITKETGSTMYMVLLSACNVLLSKYSGQEDIVIGSPAAGRPHADLQNIMGMFVNTLAMRNYPESNKTFKEFLREVKVNSLQAFENQDYQFEELIDKLSIKRDISRNPLFDVMFSLANIDTEELRIEGLKLNTYEIDVRIAKFDMMISAIESNKTIGISLNYCTKLFNKQTIENMSRHFTNILNNMADNVNQKLSEINMLSEEEKHQLLVDFNNTKTNYPKEKTIQQLFEEQADNTPDNIAVVYKKAVLTYKELNEKANIIARLLRNKGIKQNEIVGIMIEGGTEMLVGILGILKAGAGYLPIDPKYPTDRISYMIEDSKTRILLTDFQPTETVSDGIELILLTDDKLYKGESNNLEIVNTPRDIAYIIYTSGSTGKPKGVMIEHSSLINLSKWHIDYYKVTEKDNSTKYAGFGFDASVWEIFPYIITGATIHIIDEEIKLDIEKLNQYYNDNDITISFLPTQICEQFMKQENKSLRYLLAGGDKLRYFEGKNYKVVNNYGPTENTVVTTSFIVDKEYENIPIGKPIANTQIYIISKENKLQPIGIAGELCIAGESLARGYLNNNELTAEKFIENPFVEGQRLYKSGDLARWLPNGNLEFLGRIDTQVKVRGYRIELGEIESQLLKYEGIREVIVIAKEDQNGINYLCGYICGEREYSISDLREHLSKELPEYMIPAYFIQLEQAATNFKWKGR